MKSDDGNLVWITAVGCEGGACIAVAHHLNGDVLMRHSGQPDGPVLRFSRVEWDAFLSGMRAGEFD